MSNFVRTYMAVMVKFHCNYISFDCCNVEISTYWSTPTSGSY